MRFMWLFILPPIAIVAIIFFAWYRYQAHSDERDLKKVAVIAHTKTIQMLPAYRKAARRYRLLLIFAAVSLLVSIISFTAVAARPVAEEVQKSENVNRDIILCLDVSPSMTSYQKKILEFFSSLTKELRGQRIGITIFDGVPANIIPLTDDYEVIPEIIDDLSTNFEKYGDAARSGRVSAIGDGVVGCVNSMNTLDNSERSKSIVISTDNLAGAGETIDITKAAKYAKRYNIILYGLTANPLEKSQSNLAYQKAVSLTGGSFYNIRKSGVADAAIINSTVEKILSQDAARIEGATEVIHSDSPTIPLIISVISFSVFLVLIWRLHL